MARHLQVDGATADNDVVVALQAFAVVARHVHAQSAARHGEDTRHLDASLGFRRRVDAEVAAGDVDGAREVEAVRASRHDVEGAAVPLQVAAAVDAVAVGVEDADRARVDGHVALNGDAVLAVARDLQCASAVDGEAACGIKGADDGTVGVVGDRRAATETHCRVNSRGDIDSRSGVARQRQGTERHIERRSAIHCQRTVGRTA